MVRELLRDSKPKYAKGIVSAFMNFTSYKQPKFFKRMKERGRVFGPEHSATLCVPDVRGRYWHLPKEMKAVYPFIASQMYAEVERGFQLVEETETVELQVPSYETLHAMYPDQNEFSAHLDATYPNRGQSRVVQALYDNELVKWYQEEQLSREGIVQQLSVDKNNEIQMIPRHQQPKKLRVELLSRTTVQKTLTNRQLAELTLPSKPGLCQRLLKLQKGMQGVYKHRTDRSEFAKR